MTKPKLKKVTPKAPEVKAPEVKATEAKAPEAPEVKAPEIKATEAKAPEAPEVKAPEIKASEAPEIKASEAPEKKKEVPFRITRASEVFKSHSCDEVYFTCDDTCFVNQSYAHMHAANLTDPTVSTVTKKETK